VLAQSVCTGPGCVRQRHGQRTVYSAGRAGNGNRRIRWGLCDGTSIRRGSNAAVVLQPSFRDAGTVYVTAATVPYPPDVPFLKRVQAWDINKPVVTPQANVAAEQYNNRIVRLVARGIAVQLEINIAARFYDDDPMSYNVIAEIPGTDLKDEVVMVGGCIDSWHAGTGATDTREAPALPLKSSAFCNRSG
jgi:carboxypeptidase Q